MTRSQEKLRIIVDTDVDIDDWMAMLYLLTHPGVAVEGITVVGTGAAHLGPGTRNALALVQLAGRADIPVARGLDRPMRYEHAFPADIRDPVDDLFGIELPPNPNEPRPDALAFLRERLAGDKLTILAIGPLTNLGTLLQESPELAQCIERIYMMGGTIDAPGNVHAADPSIPNLVAEWNVYIDPVAADVVLRSGVPITMIPLDATQFAPITTAFYFRLLSHHSTPSAGFVYEALTADFAFLESGNFDFWDPLAAGIMTERALGRFRELRIAVDTGDDERSGQLLQRDDGAPVEVCFGADAAAFEDLFLATVNGEKTPRSQLSFILDGQPVTLDDVSPRELLIDYLHRPEVGKGGTKLVCGQGGCGACTVMLTRWDATRQRLEKRAINACLRPLASLDGTLVTTTQGIGSVKDTIDEVQHKIAFNNGSQCGFCTPGFTMNMFTLLQNNRAPTEKEIEDNFDGNICRCTGYRPILAGFKQFACDYTPPQEPMPEIRVDPNFSTPIHGFREIAPPPEFLEYMQNPQPLSFTKNGYTYVRPVSLESLYALKAEHGPTGDAFRLVCGNTSIGIYATRPIYAEAALDPRFLVDISAIPELCEVSLDAAGLTLGASVSLTRLLAVLDEVIAERDPAETRGLVALCEHVKVVANLQVRNEATIAGNVHIAANLGFLSDVVMTLGTLGSEVTVSWSGGEARYGILDLPKDVDLPKGAIYRFFHIPWTSAAEHVRTFKIRRRNEDCHAIVNAGFRVLFGDAHRVAACDIVLNGIDAGYALPATKYGIPFRPITVPETRAAMLGREWNEDTLHVALQVLGREIEAYRNDLEIEQIPFSYRAAVAQSLFYKFFIAVSLDLDPVRVPPRLRSAGESFERPVSRGEQFYNAYPEELPVSEPVVRLSAFMQATGEAVYTHNTEQPPNTLEAALVYSLVARGTFHYVLPVTTSYGNKGQRVSAEALNEFLADWYGHGFHRYVTYGDIAPDNRAANWAGLGADDPIFVPSEDQEIPAPVLADKSDVFHPEQLTCVGAPIGLVVADGQRAAREIADFVRRRCIRFTAVEPIWEFEQAVRERHFFPEDPSTSPSLTHIPEITRPGSNELWLNNPEAPLEEGDRTYEVLSGSHATGFQNHFYLETMATLAVPTENRSITLYTVTQTLADNQSVAAGVLGVPASNMRVVLMRDGGAFGGRQTRSRFNSTATALAAWVTRRPVRLVLDRATNFIMCGERHPFRGDYHAAYARDGTVKGFCVDYYSNAGNTYDVSLPVMDLGLMLSDNAYRFDTSKVTGNICQTNQLSNTAFRSFGSVQAINITEEIISKIAWKLGMTPEEVREKNLYRDGTDAWTRFEITDQTLGVLERYRYDDATLAALGPLKNRCFQDEETFMAAVNAQTGAFEDASDALMLKNYSTTSFDYTPYAQPLKTTRLRSLWHEAKAFSKLDERRQAVEAFNRDNRWRKRGLAMMPLKYGVAYTGPRGSLNQGGAYVIAYARDGSVLVQHGGVDSGQGIQTKMAQIAAETLDIPLTYIKMGPTDTNVISDASPTAASTGSDLNGGAVQLACRQLRERLERFCEDLEQYTVYFSKFDPAAMDEATNRQVETVTRNWRDHWSDLWPTIVSLAYTNRINLASEARYKTPHYSAVDLAHSIGKPFFYFTEAVGLSEVEIDVLTGDYTLLQSDILFDLGKSLNPLIDVGQIEGAFIQGVGYVTFEELLFQGPNEASRLGYPYGALTSTNTWDYKPPGTKSIPLNLRVKIVDNAGCDLQHPGPKLDNAAVKSSKGIGEPPLVLGNTVFFAIKQAILAFYKDLDYDGWVEMDAPATVQRIQSACHVAYKSPGATTRA